MALLPEEGRQDGEAGHGDGDDAADHRTEAECRGLEEPAAREALALLGRWHGRFAGARRGLAGAGLAKLRLGGDVAAAEPGRGLAGPDEDEDQGDDRADRGDPQGADDQPDEDDDHADGEAHRTDRRCRQVRSPVLCRVH